MTAALFLALSASAQVRWNQAYQQYINQYKDIAIEQMLRYKIPLLWHRGCLRVEPVGVSSPSRPTTTLVLSAITAGQALQAITTMMRAVSASVLTAQPMSRMKTTRVSSQPLVDTVRCSVWELPIIKVGLGD